MWMITQISGAINTSGRVMTRGPPRPKTGETIETCPADWLLTRTDNITWKATYYDATEETSSASPTKNMFPFPSQPNYVSRRKPFSHPIEAKKDI